MAKDYGTKRTSRQRGSTPQQFLVLLVTFLSGYLSATFLDIRTIGNWVNTQIIAQGDKQPILPKSEPKQARIPPKPKFEFYTLLANEKGAPQAKANGASSTAATVNGATAITSSANHSLKAKIPNTNQAAAVTEDKSWSSAQMSTGIYSVQVAAFKVRQDAEHLKGLLILKGFEVSVTPISTVKGNWFRVVVGPYANRDLAQKAQLTLAKTERLKGMITSTGR